MTEILIRLCVGISGLFTLAIGVSFMPDKDGRSVATGCTGFIIGLITILRALGVM